VQATLKSKKNHVITLLFLSVILVLGLVVGVVIPRVTSTDSVDRAGRRAVARSHRSLDYQGRRSLSGGNNGVGLGALLEVKHRLEMFNFHSVQPFLLPQLLLMFPDLVIHALCDCSLDHVPPK
jgi:hypothetical protein